MGALSFFVMSLGLLLTPGPTNTLLLVGGATNGFRRSLLLPPAELLGYLLSIHILAFAIGPFLTPQLKAVIRIVLAAYLVFLAIRLWGAQASVAQNAIVTPGRVFVVTLLNPKALVFAFVILPPLAGHWLVAAPYLLALSVLIAAAGLTWISLGAALKSGLIVAINVRIIQRLGALALIAFALVIGLPKII